MLARWRRSRHQSAGFALYREAATAARNPVFFRDWGVPDTLDGRFDVLCVFVSLLIRRLYRAPEPGPALAQAVFDAMFHDMDTTLREMGVGDLSVGKRVRKMWEALHGRALAYEAALKNGDLSELARALQRNVWRGADSPHASSLAAFTAEQDAHLARQALEQFAAGVVRFLEPIPEGGR
ncbi:MAG: ubiquinol-cytochrome C chaperone [Acidobacteriia bacterium]|nr:ubiquinol-cytochrome C chaperone [Methyloceanibacter sp.]MCL6493127.1 ubiquinol-cytochrome C chaperone [Terriglobia bacterium]